MQLPEGTFVTRIKNCKPGELIHYLKAFCGRVDIFTSEGGGFLLINRGSIRGASFREGEDELGGEAVVDKINRWNLTNTAQDMEFSLNKYTEDEFSSALAECARLGMVIGDTRISLPSLLFDDEQVKALLRQPGVIAVSTIFEGFAVKSMGDANFEQVAALAEDFRRAGERITDDLQVGKLQQVTLETTNSKLLITSYGDLVLCILTSQDANLGLLRLAIRSLQPRQV